MSLRVHFHDIPHSQNLQDECERLADELRADFPEALKFEVTLHHEAARFETHVHITGKEIDLASHAGGDDLRHTISEAFERSRRQLRKHHDKLVFERRRKSAKE